MLPSRSAFAEGGDAISETIKGVTSLFVKTHTHINTHTHTHTHTAVQTIELSFPPVWVAFIKNGNDVTLLDVKLVVLLRLVLKVALCLWLDHIEAHGLWQ